MAFVLGRFLFPYLGLHNIAIALGPDGHTRYFGNQIRMPDVAVILRNRLPDRELPQDPICPVAPDLAIEIRSPGNTRKEIARKLQTYFESGVRLVWVVLPRKRLVRVYTSATDFSELGENDSLDGGEILPGFRLSIREWFDAAK